MEECLSRRRQTRNRMVRSDWLVAQTAPSTSKGKILCQESDRMYSGDFEKNTKRPNVADVAPKLSGTTVQKTVQRSIKDSSVWTVVFCTKV